MSGDDNTGWYYCLTHQEVEKGKGCRGGDRMGPYPDQATAANALQIAREKTKAADEADKKWRGDDDD